jgi:hypothetical protein
MERTPLSTCPSAPTICSIFCTGRLLALVLAAVSELDPEDDVHAATKRRHERDFGIRPPAASTVPA